MDDENTTEGIPDLSSSEVIAGGRDVSITDAEGKSSTIKVKKISHLKGSSIVSAYESDLSFAMLVTGKTEAELEKEVSEDSFYHIVDVGRVINQSTIKRALDSRAKKLQNPEYQAFLKAASSLTSSLGE